MAMVVRRLADLPPRLQQLYDRAWQTARVGNATYATQVLADLLREVPGCVEARTALYDARLAAVGGRLKGWRRVLAALRLSRPLRTNGPRLLSQGRAEEALGLADRLMEIDPSARDTLGFLAQACEANGLATVALAVLEQRVRLYPCDTGCWRELADHCLRHGVPARALDALKRLAELRPDDLVIREDLRRAAVAAAAVREREHPPGQGTAGPGRVATAPEPAEDEEDTSGLPLAERIARAEARVREGAPMRAYRDLGRLYAEDRRFEDAVAILREGAARLGVDAEAFEEEIGAVHEARYADLLAGLHERLRAHPDQADEVGREIEAVTRERNRFLLEQQRHRAERHPHDSHVLFTLGEMLLRDGEWDEAMLSFEAARNHPNLKDKCCAGMGRCLAGKGHPAQAVPLFRKALDGGFSRQSHERLGVMYDLALAYEAVGQAEDANQVFKDIYAQDLTFRDVRERLARLAAGGPQVPLGHAAPRQ